MLCGNRLSPMEKRGNCSRSITSTACPCRRSKAAASAPAGPAPMIRTSCCSILFSVVIRGRYRVGKARGNEPDQGHADEHGQTKRVQGRGAAECQQAEGKQGTDGRQAHCEPGKAAVVLGRFLQENTVIDAQSQQ